MKNRLCEMASLLILTGIKPFILLIKIFDEGMGITYRRAFKEGLTDVIGNQVLLLLMVF